MSFGGLGTSVGGNACNDGGLGRNCAQTSTGMIASEKSAPRKSARFATTPPPSPDRDTTRLSSAIVTISSRPSGVCLN
jgi:hypothetical protein